MAGSGCKMESMKGENSNSKSTHPVAFEEYAGLGFEGLPESCMAAILPFTTPRDVARLACVNRCFRDASNSDSVWQKMMPRDYADILAQAPDAPAINSSKRGIYDYLSREPVLLNNSTQGFWLDRATGGVCRSLGARGMRIVWSEDTRYWHWDSVEGARFPEVACLDDVCWFEAGGSLECLLPPETYTLSWRLRLGDHSSGWSNSPMHFSLETSDGQKALIEYDLSRIGVDHALSRSSRHGAEPLPESPMNWIDVKVGTFTVEDGDRPLEVRFSMFETRRLNWKSGLFLDGVVIRPSYVLSRG